MLTVFLQVVVVPGDDETETVKAAGKTLLITYATKADNEHGAGNSGWGSYTDLPGKIEKLL